MDNKNKIIDYMQFTSAEYDDKLFQVFWSWCQKYGKTPSHTQQLLANSGVSKWWIVEYSKLEIQFINAYPHLPKKRDALVYHFYGFITQINTIYPKALIEAINSKIQQEEINIIKKLPTYYAN